MANKYIAMTIGPICDTMNLVTKPAALWLSSYMFSYISKSLCVKIAEKIGCENIITPYIPKREEADYPMLMERNDGVGLFHDHIICTYDDDLWNELPNIKADVIEDIAGKIGANKAELEKYLMIAVCWFELQKDKNAILSCGTMLDCLELPKQFNTKEKKHPVISSLSNKSAKEVAGAFGIEMDSWPLIHDVTETVNGVTQTYKAFKDIPAIASNSKTKGYKKNNYFCILRADGDNMSKIISSLDSDEKCRDFSQVCLHYCADVSRVVKAYGGITIFAGGDDLFAIVPCESEKGTVFGLIRSIIGKFEENFKKYIEQLEEFNKIAKPDEIKEIPTLSFALMMCHKKYPLYEAYEKSTELLFDAAKKKNGGKKNCTAVHIQKHSGQTAELLIKNCALAEFERLLVAIVNEKSNANAGKDDDNKNEKAVAYLLSCAQKVMLFGALLEAVEEESAVISAFKNIFDAGYHLENNKDFLHEELPKYYIDHCLSGNIKVLDKDEKEKYKKARTLGQVIRLMKFFVEKGED